MSVTTSSQVVSNIFKLLAVMLLYCCCYADCQQQQQEMQQQQQHQYQQLQYQMQQQQQQQYEYQQQMQQQQQQNSYQQQYQQQQQQLQQQLQQKQQQQQQDTTGPMSLALQQKQQQQQHLDNIEQHLAPTHPQNLQMLKTGVSLVVDDGSHDSIYGSEPHGQKEYADSNDGLGIELQQPTRRRRPGTRKRKRRPQLAVALEGSIGVGASSSEDEQTKYWHGQVEDDAILRSTVETNRREDTRGGGGSRRRKQPAIREPLAALEKEQKLFEMRDKQRQDYGGGGDGTVVGGGGNKSYRRPYSQAKKELHTSPGTAETLVPTVAGSVTGTSTAGVGGGGAKSQVDLKNILKNSGGMSLSEILQQKNLSLDDLLKGKQKALLALQTTAVSPTQKSEGSGIRPGKPVRRLPTASLGAAPPPPSTSNTHLGAPPNASSEDSGQTESDEPHTKNKLKFPALQRLKLFGGSSRSTTTIQGNGETSSRKPTTSTPTTTTTTKTTTPRVPIYRKRLQQRPTLKSPTLFKATATTTVAKEEPTSMETLITTLTSNEEPQEEQDQELSAVDDNQENSEVPEDPVDLMEPEDIMENLNEAAGDKLNVSEEKMEASEDKLEDAEEHTKPTTITTPASTTRRMSTTTTKTTTTTTTKPTTNNRTNPARTSTAGKQSNLRLKTTLSERVHETNFIENDEGPAKMTTKTSATSSDSVESSYADDLENFFEEEQEQERSDPKTKSNESTSSTEEEEESITSRVERRRPPQQKQPTSSFSPTTSYLDEIPDFDGVDDRTDLLELIEDRRSSNRLFKVLEQRNMTLEELIEHRKRGSSQLHLSTIVQNRSRFFPGQKVVLHDNMDIVTAFENFPHFNLMDLKSVKPDDIKTDSQGSSYFTSIIDIEPTDEIYKDGGGSGGVDIRGPTYTQPQRSEKSLGFFPSWKTLALASLATTSRDPNIKRNPFFLPQPKLLLENTSQEVDDEEEEQDDENLILPNNQQSNRTNSDIRQKSESSSSAIVDTVEAIENEVARAHDLLDLELSGHGFKRSPALAAAATSISNQNHHRGNLYTNMPAGIRSAIVASAAIVLTSLATFMVIFIVCRWKQRKRRKTNYMKTYNAMKSKLPTIATNSRRSSLRNMEEMVGGCVVSTVSVSSSASPPPPVHHHHNQLQRQSSLLFPPTRVGSRDSIKGNCTSVSSTNALLSGRSIGNSGGIGSATGSTTSLALSLQSAHNISSTKLNTMDPNSPEVQEYLFDTLRKSF